MNSISGHIVGITINGTSVVNKAYYNNQLVFENHADVTDVKSAGTYVTFRSTAPFTLYKSMSWDNTMYYSTNKVHWYIYTGEDVLTAKKQSDGNYELYLRGVGNRCISGAVGSKFSYSGTAKYSIVGNIFLLADYKKVVAGEDMSNSLDAYAYYSLFSGNAKLERFIDCDISGNSLPDSCFENAFSNCTSLVEIPTISVSVVADNMFREAFLGCSALQEIKQTAFSFYYVGTAGCYNMFYGCTALKNAPNFSEEITVLSASAFNNMYGGCSSLTTGPTVIKVQHCYMYALAFMFSKCTSLINAADITISSAVGEYACKSTYEYCSKLTEPGSITTGMSATPAVSEFDSMFCNCRALEKLPKLSGIACTAIYMFYNTFAFCTSLKQVYRFKDVSPYNYLQNITLPEGVFSNMFYETAVHIGSEGEYSNSYVFTDRRCTAGTGSFSDFVSNTTIEPNTTYSTDAEIIEV